VSGQNPDHPLTSYALLYEAVALATLDRPEERTTALEAAESSSRLATSPQESDPGAG